MPFRAERRRIPSGKMPERHSDSLLCLFTSKQAIQASKQAELSSLGFAFGLNAGTQVPANVTLPAWSGQR